jgi:hypothetical protein
MNYHKECVTYSVQNVRAKYHRCCLFTDSYDKSIPHLQRLADLAMEEFTDITIHTIEVVQLNSNYAKGIMAVEFLTTQTPDSSWIRKETLQPKK